MVVAVNGGGVGTVGSIKIGIDGGGSLAHVGVGAAEDIVGAHALVGITVAVEIPDKVFGQRVVMHHAVGTVHALQLFKLPEHLLVTLAAGDKQQKQHEGKNTVTKHCLPSICPYILMSLCSYVFISLCPYVQLYFCSYVNHTVQCSIWQLWVFASRS